MDLHADLWLKEEGPGIAADKNQRSIRPTRATLGTSKSAKSSPAASLGRSGVAAILPATRPRSTPERRRGDKTPGSAYNDGRQADQSEGAL
jgi:hypothetical protein